MQTHGRRYAWRLVRVLEFNAIRQGHTAMRFQLTMIAITFFTVLVTIVLQWAPDDVRDMTPHALKPCVLSLCPARPHHPCHSSRGASRLAPCS